MRTAVLRAVLPALLILVAVTATARAGGIVSGDVLYWTGDRPVPGVRLELTDPLHEAWTDAGGFFEFPYLPTGDYEIVPEKLDDIYCVNALDGIRTFRTALGMYVPPEPFGFDLADLTGDGYVTATDALECLYQGLGIGTVTPDWLFDPASMSFTELDGDTTVVFTAGLRGDMNGDWLPGLADRGRDDIVVSLPEQVYPTSTSDIEIPIHIQGPVTMAALSLAISYDPAVVAFDSVTSSVDGISVASNVVGSELRLGWFDYIGMTPVQMTAGNLTTLCFRSLLDPGESGVSTLDFTVLSMLGDTMGDRIWNATFDDGRIIIGEPSSGVGDATRRPARITGNYPNPFNPSTTVMFGVDEAGPVSVAVFDVAGRRVRGLVSDVRYEAGEHAVAWDGRDDAGRAVPSGIYFCRLVTGTGTDTGKLVLQK